MRSPSCSSARWHRRPPTSVPFFDPRSSMVQEPRTRRKSACEADIQASSTPTVRRGTPDPSPRKAPRRSARPSITSSTCSREQRIAGAPGRSQLSTRKRCGAPVRSADPRLISRDSVFVDGPMASRAAPTGAGSRLLCAAPLRQGGGSRGATGRSRQADHRRGRARNSPAPSASQKARKRSRGTPAKRVPSNVPIGASVRRVARRR